MKNRSFLILLLLALFFSGFKGKTQNKSKEITIEDIWLNYKFYPRNIDNIYHLKDGEHYCIEEEGRIMKYSYNSVSAGELIMPKISIKPDNFSFSENEQKILIAAETERIYRYSVKATYFVYDIKSSQLKSLTDKGKVIYPAFSPDGSKVAFVYENNIYIKNLEDNTETQISADGLKDKIINGMPDWVYEEEFDLRQAYQWSPDGSKLIWFRFDESAVKQYQLTFYKDLYNETYNYKYPKAGEANSIVELFIYDLKSKSVKKIDTGKETDQYLPVVQWTALEDKLSVQKLNRMQNKLEILIADINSGNTDIIYTESNKYYIDVIKNLTFLKDNKQIILNSERDGYNHIYIYNIKSGQYQQLTKGSWDVTDIEGVNQTKKIIYYSSVEESPLEKALYSIDFEGKNKKLISSKKGANTVDFSRTYRYYINTFSDKSTPPVYTINTSDGKELRVLENNEGLAQTLKQYNFGKTEFFKFKTDENIELNGWMLKPADFNPANKYPVLMTVYGGPGSQTVKNNWGGQDFVWYQMLAAKGYIIVSVDNRGTGARGEEFKKCTYQKIGVLESDDQIAAAKYLGALPFIDASRIGIWGWSYGGYMTALCLTKGAEWFKMGVAVAPVTDWRFYDNVYAERFMRRPVDNEKGYAQSSVMTYIDNFKGKLLIIHGSTDDNVHLQNTMVFTTAMNKANKHFDMFIYPDKNHFIYGGNTRCHLFNKITEYILKNL